MHTTLPTARQVLQHNTGASHKTVFSSKFQPLPLPCLTDRQTTSQTMLHR